MPRLICSECQREMVPSPTGVNVLEVAKFGPYKIWEADEWICPDCGYVIIAIFGAKPVAVHRELGFQRILNEVQANTYRYREFTRRS